MELSQLVRQHAACVSVDWVKFLASINREIGNQLLKETMTHDDATAEAYNYLSAERRLGPSYSIAVALAMMAAWTRAIMKRTPCDPEEFIDDSSLQYSSNDPNQVVEAIIRSLDQCELFGS
eukprot:775362-Pyramimonas_sp.AAC.1